MSFSYASGVITQTGTDTDLSGLNGLTGITVINGAVRKLYILDGVQLRIEGTQTINPLLSVYLLKTGVLNIMFVMREH